MSVEAHQSSKPQRVCGLGHVDITAYFTLWLERLETFYEERDRRYEDRFKAQETAVAAALASSEKLTGAAFAASKEAIVKAETAQTTYNTSHNDLTRKMDEQYKQMMPRPESDAKFEARDEKIEELKKEISVLREARSKSGGREEVVIERRARSEWIIGLFIMAGLTLFGLILALAELFIRKP